MKQRVRLVLVAALAAAAVAIGRVGVAVSEVHHSATSGSPLAARGLVVAETTRRGLYAVDLASGRARQLTIGSDRSPAFAPNGRMIAFVRGSRDAMDIWVVRADGTGLKRLTRAANADHSPTWSTDGKTILFVSHRLDFEHCERPTDILAGTPKLFSMRPDGRDQKVLFPDRSWSEYSPRSLLTGLVSFQLWRERSNCSFSPYYAFADSAGAVRTRPMPGALAGSYGTFIQLSPSGRRLVGLFEDNPSRVRASKIVTADLNGHHQRLVARLATSVSWGLTDQMLLFTRPLDFGGDQICAITASGSRQFALSDNAVDSRLPSFEHAVLQPRARLGSGRRPCVKNVAYRVRSARVVPASLRSLNLKGGRVVVDVYGVPAFLAFTLYKRQQGERLGSRCVSEAFAHAQGASGPPCTFWDSVKDGVVTGPISPGVHSYSFQRALRLRRLGSGRYRLDVSALTKETSAFFTLT